MKINVILALAEQGASVFKALVSDYTSFFTKKQGHFKGIKKTYEAIPGTMDEPSLRGITKIETTVDEKLQWFEEQSCNYLDQKLSIEATNASGTAGAELIVAGKSFGYLSTLELMSLKSLLENRELTSMYSNIPVRSDSEIWNKSENEDYLGRDIYEQALMSGTRKTTLKEQYVLDDPNISKLKDASGYKPQISSRDTTVELGYWSTQNFSGEWTHTKRANLLARKNVLYLAVIEALKKANDVTAVESNIKAKQIFKYLHYGEL